jgi:hypothetical protein
MGTLGRLETRSEKANARLGGVALTTHGRTLRERCTSVRWKLAKELVRLAFVAISLAAAFLTLSWQVRLESPQLARCCAFPLNPPCASPLHPAEPATERPL